MAEQHLIARRYAVALIEVASQQDASDVVGRDLTEVNAWLAGEGQLLSSALCSPVFGFHERTAVLQQILQRLTLHPLTANLLQLVNEKGRFALLAAIADEYGALADQRAGRVRAYVQTAEPLSGELEASVRDALASVTGQTVEMSIEVRPELIGGLVVRLGDRVYDTSLRTHLQQIKQALLSSQLPGQA